MTEIDKRESVPKTFGEKYGALLMAGSLVLLIVLMMLVEVFFY